MIFQHCQSGKFDDAIALFLKAPDKAELCWRTPMGALEDLYVELRMRGQHQMAEQVISAALSAKGLAEWEHSFRSRLDEHVQWKTEQN